MSTKAPNPGNDRGNRATEPTAIDPSPSVTPSVIPVPVSTSVAIVKTTPVPIIPSTPPLNTPLNTPIVRISAPANTATSNPNTDSTIADPVASSKPIIATPALIAIIVGGVFVLAICLIATLAWRKNKKANKRNSNSLFADMTPTLQKQMVHNNSIAEIEAQPLRNPSPASSSITIDNTQNSSFASIVTASIPPPGAFPVVNESKPMQAQALQPHIPRFEGELMLQSGEILHIYKTWADGMAYGVQTSTGVAGYLPATILAFQGFVQVNTSNNMTIPTTAPGPQVQPQPTLQAPVTVNDTRKVIIAYAAQRDDELTLTVGDEINVESEFDDGWCFASLNGKQGFCPVNSLQSNTADNRVSVLSAQRSFSSMNRK